MRRLNCIIYQNFSLTFIQYLNRIGYTEYYIIGYIVWPILLQMVCQLRDERLKVENAFSESWRFVPLIFLISSLHDWLVPLFDSLPHTFQLASHLRFYSSSNSVFSILDHYLIQYIIKTINAMHLLTKALQTEFNENGHSKNQYESLRRQNSSPEDRKLIVLISR